MFKCIILGLISFYFLFVFPFAKLFELISILFSFCFYFLENNTSENIQIIKDIAVNKEITTCILELLLSTLNWNPA